MRARTWVHRQSMAMASCTLLFPLALPLLLPFLLVGARTRFLPSRLPALMMAFFPLLTSPPIFLPLLPSGARALSPHARVCLNRLLLHLFLVRHPRTLGRIPFPFLPSPLSRFLYLLPSVSCPRVSSRSFPPPPIPACASCFTSLSSSSPLSRRTVFVPCPFLAHIACHYVSLCRSLISLPPPSLLFPSATGEST